MYILVLQLKKIKWILILNNLNKFLTLKVLNIKKKSTEHNTMCLQFHLAKKCILQNN